MICDVNSIHSNLTTFPSFLQEVWKSQPANNISTFACRASESVVDRRVAFCVTERNKKSAACSKFDRHGAIEGPRKGSHSCCKSYPVVLWRFSKKGKTCIYNHFRSGKDDWNRSEKYSDLLYDQECFSLKNQRLLLRYLYIYIFVSYINYFWIHTHVYIMSYHIIFECK